MKDKVIKEAIDDETVWEVEYASFNESAKYVCRNKKSYTALMKKLNLQVIRDTGFVRISITTE